MHVQYGLETRRFVLRDDCVNCIYVELCESVCMCVCVCVRLSEEYVSSVTPFLLLLLPSMSIKKQRLDIDR